MRAMPAPLSDIASQQAQAAQHLKQGAYMQALQVYDALLAQNPQHLSTLIEAATLCQHSLGKANLALPYYARALAIAPEHRLLRAAYAEALSYAGAYDQSYAQAKMLLPPDSDTPPCAEVFMLLSIFARAGDIATVAHLVSLPQTLDYWLNHNEPSRFLYAMAHAHTDACKQRLLQYHRRWGEIVEQHTIRHSSALPPKKLPPWQPLATAENSPLLEGCPEGAGCSFVASSDNTPSGCACHPSVRGELEGAAGVLPKKPRLAGHKIRVGFLSGDLRKHAVSYFVHPIFDLYNRSQFDFFVYNTNKTPADAVQQHLRTLVTRFDDIWHYKTALEIARHIAADDLDILIDLGGVTYQNRADALVFKPARVQVSWLGYPHSLGLSAIDYLLVDKYLCPKANYMLEKPLILPESWVTLGQMGFSPRHVIEPTTPYQRNGYITFGTMNNPNKYTTTYITAVAYILHNVPHARFVFVRPEGQSTIFRQHIGALFAAHGIDATRIDYVPVWGNHMVEYNRIDIALDTFPHTGGTTTCETLWMGVPVVSLVGEAFFERISYSNLNNAGLGSLCASSIAEYVQIASHLAHNKEWLHDWRHNARQYIRQRPLGQTEQFVRNFEQTIMQAV